MDITVLGGGNGGFATAADLALAGHRVRLWSRSRQALGPLADDPTIPLGAEGRQGTAPPAPATTQPAEAVPRAGIVIGPLPPTRHDDLATPLPAPADSRQI